MIGACVLQGACAMPAGTEYATQAECVAAVIVRKMEHPGNVYGCVPINLSQDQITEAVRELRDGASR
jgi:hypothetical protein